MDEEFLFCVTSTNGESSFTLPKIATVEDLKHRIHESLGIPPYKQIIECWYRTPSSDTSILVTCCSPNTSNNLVVYNVEHMWNPTDSTEDKELSSIDSFRKYYERNYKNSSNFALCTLKEAINIITEKKQILLLYFHNNNEPFSKTFCKNMADPDVQKILDHKFMPLCWDIESEIYHSSLIKALQQYEELSQHVHCIKKKVCCAWLIAPDEKSLMIVARMDETVDLQLALKNARTFVGEEKTEDTREYVFGSKEFHQNMMDMLSDRDYDSFEFDEHEFLKAKILYACFGPPLKEEGYDDKQKKKMETLFEKILEESNHIAKWTDRVIISFIYVATEPLDDEKKKRAKKHKDYDPKSDITPFPIFILRKCKHSDNPCRVFIDDNCRVYESWENYLDNNKLPKCKMVYPVDGRYDCDEAGKVRLGSRFSPACDVSNTVLKVADISSAVGGIASGGAFMAASAISAVAAAPLVVPIATATGVGILAYSLGRSIYTLVDRGLHKESLNPFESSEARGAYINIVAGLLGFAGAGANLVVSQLVAKGVNIGSGTSYAINTLNIVNIGAGGAGIANGTYEVVRNWIEENEAPSLLTIVQLGSSVLFFGHAVYNYKSVNTVIEESQAKMLKDYRDSLRSNRHRKTFNKLLKETIRQNDGNVQRGRAEVISAIKNIGNKDEVFAFLTRSNKEFNKKGVRFAAGEGTITLNGVTIEMSQFANMQKSEVITFLGQLPSKPNPTQLDIKAMGEIVSSAFGNASLLNSFYITAELAKIFLCASTTIKEKIIKAVALLIEKLIGNPIMAVLDKIMPGHAKYIQMVHMVNRFFQTMIDEEEDKYQKWSATKDHKYEKRYFYGLSSDRVKRATEIFEKVTEAYFTGTNLNRDGLEKLLHYFYTWVASKIYDSETKKQRCENRTAHSPVAAPKIRCKICKGQFYNPK